MIFVFKILFFHFLFFSYLFLPRNRSEIRHDGRQAMPQRIQIAFDNSFQIQLLQKFQS